MSAFEFSVESGKTITLPTAGKYCDRDIVVTATGGGDTDAVYEQGVADGKQAEYDRFWDEYQDSGNRTNYEYAFAGLGWNEKTFFPKYNVFSGNTIHYILRNNAFAGDFVQRMIDLGFGDVCFTPNSPTQPFRAMLNVTRLPVIRPTATGYLYALNYCYSDNSSLETIDCVLGTCPNTNRGITFTSAFDGCTSLKNIRFEGTIVNPISFKDSGLLSDESVQDIIDHLGDLTGQTAKTVQFHSEVVLRLTAEQVDAIATKNWTI